MPQHQKTVRKSIPGVADDDDCRVLTYYVIVITSEMTK